jgi:N-methylhydantoinase A
MLTARGLMDRPQLERQSLGGADASAAKLGRRPIFVSTQDAMVEADIYDFEKLKPGNVVAGPGVIHTPITTIVLQPAQVGRVDDYRNIVIDFQR